jgi:hypothetical protein
MGETRILIRLLRMYFPRNWEFDSALSKLWNFGTPLTEMIHELKIFTKYTAEMNEFEVSTFLCVDMVVDVTNIWYCCN